MANDGVEFSILGLDSILGKFDAVTQDVKFKGGRSSLRKAANVLAEKVREGARRFDDAETGRSIAENVAVRWDTKKFKYSGDLAFRVGILKGAILAKKGQPVNESPGAPTPHWRLKEFGTETMPAEPFMRPALADNINEITGVFIDEYDKSLGRSIKRAAKKRL